MTVVSVDVILMCMIDLFREGLKSLSKTVACVAPRSSPVASSTSCSC